VAFAEVVALTVPALVLALAPARAISVPGATCGTGLTPVTGTAGVAVTTAGGTTLTAPAPALAGASGVALLILPDTTTALVVLAAVEREVDAVEVDAVEEVDAFPAVATANAVAATGGIAVAVVTAVVAVAVAAPARLTIAIGAAESCVDSSIKDKQKT